MSFVPFSNDPQAADDGHMNQKRHKNGLSIVKRDRRGERIVTTERKQGNNHLKKDRRKKENKSTDKLYIKKENRLKIISRNRGGGEKGERVKGRR